MVRAAKRALIYFEAVGDLFSSHTTSILPVLFWMNTDYSEEPADNDLVHFVACGKIAIHQVSSF